MWVSIAVVADVVSRFVYLLYLVGIFVNPISAEEKGCLDIVVFEDLKQSIGVIGAPSGRSNGKRFLFFSTLAAILGKMCFFSFVR